MKAFSFKVAGKAFKDAFGAFGDDKITKLSASLAYFTVFSLAPLLIVVISVFGFFFGREALQGQIETQISGLVGADAAKQVQEMLKNAAISGKGPLATIIGVIALLIGATGVFAEIQDSINGIWGLKPKPKVGIMKMLKNRLLSFGLIGSMGFLLLVSLMVSTVVEGLSESLSSIVPDVTAVIFYILNIVLTIAIVTSLFAVIFKVLPDAKISWRQVLPGAFVTSLLFMIGKFAIGLYVTKSEIGSTYGAAGSLIVLLVWIYYSSIILYFGAEFTKFYVFDGGGTVIPNRYAQWVNENTVGQPKDPGRLARKDSRPPHREPNQVVPRPVSNHQQNKKKKGPGKPGIATVLAGIALYYFNKKG